MNRSYSYSSIKFLLVLSMLAGCVFFRYSSVWAASDVAVSVSSDFLKRLNQKLTEPVRAVQQPAGPDHVKAKAEVEQPVPSDTAPHVKQAVQDVQFGPAPKFIHENGRFIEMTPKGVMLGWWDLPTGTIVFGYGPGGGIIDAHVVVHGTEKSFLKPENLSTALTSSKIAGLKLPQGIAYEELLVAKFISETPTNVEHGWWDLPDETIVFARNANGRPTGAYMVIHGEKTHLKPVALNWALERFGARAGGSAAKQRSGSESQQQAGSARPQRSAWLDKEFKF